MTRVRGIPRMLLFKQRRRLAGGGNREMILAGA
jgi:hypothetical protein